MTTLNSVPDLTFIMCAYNEIDRIQSALDDLYTSVEGRTETFEVIVIDNGSGDGTREWLEKVDLLNLSVVLNLDNLGKGGSIKKGIALSKGRHVVIHDPDMEYRAADVWRLLDAAREDRSPMVLGSRTLGGHDISYHYFANYLGVRFLSALVNGLYGSKLTDTATAMKLMDGDMARGLRLQSTGFDLDFELVVRVLRLGHSISECRVDYFPRTKAEGKKLRAWRDGLLALRAIVRDRLLPRSRFMADEVVAEVAVSHVEGP